MDIQRGRQLSVSHIDDRIDGRIVRGKWTAEFPGEGPPFVRPEAVSVEVLCPCF